MLFNMLRVIFKEATEQLDEEGNRVLESTIKELQGILHGKSLIEGIAALSGVLSLLVKITIDGENGEDVSDYLKDVSEL